MDLLLESGLVKPWGRKDAPGRPTLWVTTPRFLSQFGLRSLRDLPSLHLTRKNTNGPASSIEALAPTTDSQITDVTEPLDKNPQLP